MKADKGQQSDKGHSSEFHSSQGNRVGDRVICNGFPGIVIRTRDSEGSAWLGAMVEVKLDSGVVCVDQKELQS